MYTERNLEMLRRRENGENYASIAESYGVSESRVCQICHEMKIKEKEQNEEDSQNEEMGTNGAHVKKAIAYLKAYIQDDTSVYVDMRSLRMQEIAKWLGYELVSINYDNTGETDSLTHVIEECRGKGISLIIARNFRQFGRSLEETWKTIEYLNHLEHPIGVYFYEYGLLTNDEASLASWRLFTDMLED